MSSPKTRMTRRTVLRAATAVPALGITLGAPPATAATPSGAAVTPPPARWGVQPFELGDVKLRDIEVSGGDALRLKALFS